MQGFSETKCSRLAEKGTASGVVIGHIWSINHNKDDFSDWNRSGLQKMTNDFLKFYNLLIGM